LTHKFAKTGRYASEEENGEDMCQIQAPISFREFKKIVWERAIRGHHMKRGKTYAKAVKLVYDGGFCCKKREKRLTGIPIKASEPFHPFK